MNTRARRITPAGLGWLAASVTAGLATSTYSYAAAGDGAILEEVVITAERREADAQKSAISISVIGGDELAAKGISNTMALLDSVPGLDITHANVNSNISLRGLASGGSTQYADPVVAFNIGGVPLSRQFATSGAMYDLQRVEVLKGPQGTLYGRNATVGALNLIPNRPTHEFGGNFGLEVGNYNSLRLTGAMNLPLSDTWAMRVAGSTNSHSGYLSNGYDDASNQAGRISALFEPSNGVSLLLWADYYRDNSKGPGSVYRYVVPGQEWQDPSNEWFAFAPAGCGDVSRCPTWGNSAGPAYAAPFTNQSVVGDNGYVNLKQALYSAELNIDTAVGNLTVIPAHVDTHMDTLSYSTGLTFWPMLDAKQNSLETRLASNGNGALRWVGGLFYFNEQIDALLRSFEPGGYQLVRSPNLEDTSYAAFGEATFSITDSFRLTGGLRYTKEQKKQDGFTLLTGAVAGCPAQVAGPATYDIYQYPNGYCIVPNSGNLKFSDTSWKVGVEFDVADQSLLYANVRTGFKAGGLAPALPPNTYKKEKLTAYEIGSKNRFLDQRLQANVELFYWDYKDQQISILRPLTPAGQSGWPVNVPGWIYGAEIDLQAAVTNVDTLKLDVLYEKGEYKLFPTTVSSSGNLGGLTDYPRINMPTISSTLSAEHRFEFASGAKLVLGADAHYESATWLRPIAYASRTIGDRREQFVTENLDLTYHNSADNWSVTAFINNLTNEAIVGTGTAGGVSVGTFYRPASNAAGARYATLQPPRTYGLRLNAKF